MNMERLSDADLFTLPNTFMGAPYGRPGPNNKAAILGIPFDCGTNMRIGARGGPDSVREKSQLMRRFNPTNADFDPVEALGLVDCGNVKLTPSKIVDAFERTEQAVDRIVQAGAIPVTIGGDGSVTVPVNTASFDLSTSNNYDVVLRGQRLYDRKNRTYTGFGTGTLKLGFHPASARSSSWK